MNTHLNAGASEEVNLRCLASVRIASDDWNDWKQDFEKLLNSLLQSVLDQVPLDDSLKTQAASTFIEVSFLLTSDAEIQDLNSEFRGKDKPTNVLSFPDTELTAQNLLLANEFEENLCLGDIALADGVIRNEAREQSKSEMDHFTHLVIHGILHLLGYDHVDDAQANEMETLEIAILDTFNIQNPYITDL
ncbi:rRNA maturation RNase YbeY [Sneathiella glossodoripedis]|uniref:rRNA maturation RNase YbeY n=1 Tax=Sneathiella glossodoripedis TaxID=418853 RepID=UPI0006876B03|nr:rRNA maturation RNase YbeY [Sneathiella glossodoripedis]